MDEHDGTTPGSHGADGTAAATGDARVDEALQPLRKLDDLPVHEHAALVEHVHQALQERLAVGEDPGAGGEG